MITHLRLKTASSSGQPPLVIETPPSITIFVGPNNAGKSLALQEILRCCTTGINNTSHKIVERLNFKGDDLAKVNDEYEKIKVSPNLGEIIHAGNSIIKIGQHRFQVSDEGYIKARIYPDDNPTDFAGVHLQFFTRILNGVNRIQLLNPQSQGDLKNPIEIFPILFTNDKKREELRKIIHDSIGLYFAMDVSNSSQLQIRFGSTPPPKERSFEDETIDYMRKARSLEEVSDGVKAYTGILLQLHVGNPKVIIVDEPEAFLHPSLAYRLGYEMAKGAISENKHVFASTHSSQFLMGAISSGAHINIIRLTHDGSTGTARLLPNAELVKLMRDPLLRSTGILEGLFYKYIIVGEANADRAFYQEINERLIAANDMRGTPDILFVNANNKQTIPKIIAPMRKLGIPSVAIADIDILKDGGEEWTRHLSSCCMPSSDHPPLSTKRANTLRSLKEKTDDFKTAGGLDLLNGEVLEAANNLMDELERYGLFIVRRGEIEAWLSTLDVSRNKRTWLSSIFEKMGNDPRDLQYIKPTLGDVWDFIGDVGKWLKDTRRKGIPL